MMSDVGIKITQLRILLRIWRHKIGTELFEPETKMKDLCGEMIESQFIEYTHVHEVSSTPKLIIYWVDHSVAIF